MVAFNRTGSRADQCWHALLPPGAVCTVCTRAVFRLIVAKSSVSVMHADSTSPYRFSGKCVRYTREQYFVYRRPGQFARYACAWYLDLSRPGAVCPVCTRAVPNLITAWAVCPICSRAVFRLSPPWKICSVCTRAGSSPGFVSGGYVAIDI